MTTKPTTRKSPAARPDILKVVQLTRPEQPPVQIGRPKKLELPPVPAEIYAGMSDLEREHFDFFIASFKREHPDLTPSDQLCLVMAALEYINYLRLQVQQLTSRELVTMSRQHPGVQLRAWLDSMSVTRRDRVRRSSNDDDEKRKNREMLLGLSG